MLTLERDPVISLQIINNLNSLWPSLILLDLLWSSMQGVSFPAGMNTVAKSRGSLGRIVVTRIEAGIRCFDLWQCVKGPTSYIFKSIFGQGAWTHLILQTHLKISLWWFWGQLNWDLGVKVVQPFHTNFQEFSPQTFIDFIMPCVWRVLV